MHFLDVKDLETAGGKGSQQVPVNKTHGPQRPQENKEMLGEVQGEIDICLVNLIVVWPLTSLEVVTVL